MRLPITEIRDCKRRAGHACVECDACRESKGESKADRRARLVAVARRVPFEVDFGNPDFIASMANSRDANQLHRAVESRAETEKALPGKAVLCQSCRNRNETANAGKCKIALDDAVHPQLQRGADGKEACNYFLPVVTQQKESRHYACPIN